MELVDGHAHFAFACVLMARGTATSPLFAKNLPPATFLNAKTLLGFKSAHDLNEALELVDGLEPPTC